MCRVDVGQEEHGGGVEESNDERQQSEIGEDVAGEVAEDEDEQLDKDVDQQNTEGC